MIEIKLPFHEDSVTTMFRSRRFFLEALAGEKVEAVDDATAFRVVNKMNLVGKKDFWLSVLRTHRPTHLILFKGCEYFSNQWWIAKIKVDPVTASKTGTMYFVLIGWTNDFHGTGVAIAGASVQEDQADELFNDRCSAKLGKGYETTFSLEDVSLAVSVSLPKIKGLPDYDEVFPEEDPDEYVPSPVRPPPRVMPTVSPDPVVEPDPFSVVVPKTDGVVEEKRKADEEEKKEQRKERKRRKKEEKVNSIKELMASRRKESKW